MPWVWMPPRLRRRRPRGWEQQKLIRLLLVYAGLLAGLFALYVLQRPLSYAFACTRIRKTILPIRVVSGLGRYNIYNVDIGDLLPVGPPIPEGPKYEIPAEVQAAHDAFEVEDVRQVEQLLREVASGWHGQATGHRQVLKQSTGEAVRWIGSGLLIVGTQDSAMTIARTVEAIRWRRRALRFLSAHWRIPAATIALLPVVSLLKRTPEHGSCANCGYDLRATPDTCPECGRNGLKGT